METLLKRLNDAQVRYVVIGGQAMLQQDAPFYFGLGHFCSTF